MTFVNTGTIGLIILAATGYVVATIGMKLGSTAITGLAILLVAGGLIAAAMAEVAILRTADLGIVYVTITAVETLAILCFAALIGEGLDLRQLTGAGLVLAGVMLVSA